MSRGPRARAAAVTVSGDAGAPATTEAHETRDERDHSQHDEGTNPPLPALSCSGVLDDAGIYVRRWTCHSRSLRATDGHSNVLL